MKKLSLTVAILVLFLAPPVCGMGLAEIKSSDQLARFIYNMIRDNVPSERLLKGVESEETLKILDYETEIPVREVFATIVIEQFGDKLEGRLFESNKTYATRAICAFRDSKERVWRFTVGILEERQYSLLKKFLEKQLKKEKRK